MSDYLRNKAVRIPFPKEILKRCDTDDPWECEIHLREILGEFWDNNENSFKLECSDKRHYIDWVYYSTYGEESGDFGNVKMLTQNEINTISPYFDLLSINYKNDDLRVVDYCYYNCCEAPDYYDVDNDDDSDLFIKQTKQ